jgi:uncharacterized protein HemY
MNFFQMICAVVLFFVLFIAGGCAAAALLWSASEPLAEALSVSEEAAFNGLVLTIILAGVACVALHYLTRRPAE